MDDLANLAIGQKLVQDYPEVTNVATRINETEILHEQFRKSDGVLLFSMVLNIQTGEPKLRHFHQNFWTITLDGKPFNPAIQPMPKLKTITANRESGILTLISV